MTGGRHYGLDWLRIAAFCILIPFHTAMVFAPEHWLVKATDPVEALAPVLALFTPWRLALLFAVSGFASRMLYEKARDPGAFLKSRNARLLIPLGFAFVALLPAEVWVRAVQGGYDGSLPRFWTIDYWRWGTYWGVEMPSWEHLWFVAYLWFYTLILCGLLATGLLARAQALFDRLTAGVGLLWLPIAGLVLAKLAIMFLLPEHGGILTDWNAHVVNLQLFLYGFLIAGARHAFADLARLWRQAALVAAIAALVVLDTLWQFPGDSMPGHGWMAADRMARMAMAWAMICLLFHLADRWWNRDHRWRATFAEAVFPAYIVHHVAIVLIAWWLRPVGGAGWFGEYLAILSGTLAACVAFYVIGSRIAPLRPLIGLKPRATAAPAISGMGGEASMPRIERR